MRGTKLLIASAACFFFSTEANAVWVKVGATEDDTVMFVNNVGLKGKGDIVDFWEKENYSKRQKNMDGAMSAERVSGILCKRDFVQR